MRNIPKDMEYTLGRLFEKARTSPSDLFYVTEPCGDLYLLAIMRSKYGITYSITDMTEEGLGNVRFFRKALEFKEYCMKKSTLHWRTYLFSLLSKDVIINTSKSIIQGQIIHIEAEMLHILQPYTIEFIKIKHIINIEEEPNYENRKNNEMPNMQKKSPCGEIMDS